MKDLVELHLLPKFGWIAFYCFVAMATLISQISHTNSLIFLVQKIKLFQINFFSLQLVAYGWKRPLAKFYKRWPNRDVIDYFFSKTPYFPIQTQIFFQKKNLST